MITDKIKQKQSNIYSTSQLTLAFLGDSVTHGCFELIPRNTGGFNVVCDFDAVYHNRIKQILAVLYPELPVNIINAGISGDSAPSGLARMDSDVLKYSPDLTVVCYGLNDAGKGIDKVDEYLNALSGIFGKLKAAGSDIILLTPNMIGQRTNERIVYPYIQQIAASICTEENSSSLDYYIERVIQLCCDEGVKVCDCYALWKTMQAAGVDITSMLSNDINHPSRELHYMFAYELVKLMLTEF